MDRPRRRRLNVIYIHAGVISRFQKEKKKKEDEMHLLKYIHAQNK